MCHSRLSVLRVTDPLDGGAVFSCDRDVDGAGLVGLTGDNGRVLPVDRVVFHGIGEDAGAVWIFCQEHKPGGIPIEPVHSTKHKGRRFISVVPGNPVRQGVLIMSLGWMDRHSGRFVDHEDMFILKDNREIHGDRKNLIGTLFLCDVDR